MDPYTCATVSHDPPRRFISAHELLCVPKCVSFLVFFGAVLATCYSEGPWTDFDAKNTPKHAVLTKDVPFQGREHII